MCVENNTHSLTLLSLSLSLYHGKFSPPTGSSTKVYNEIQPVTFQIVDIFLNKKKIIIIIIKNQEMCQSDPEIAALAAEIAADPSAMFRLNSKKKKLYRS